MNGSAFYFQCYKQKYFFLSILNCVTVVLLNHIVYNLDRAFYCKLLSNCYVILCPNTANKVLCCYFKNWNRKKACNASNSSLVAILSELLLLRAVMKSAWLIFTFTLKYCTSLNHSRVAAVMVISW